MKKHLLYYLLGFSSLGFAFSSCQQEGWQQEVTEIPEGMGALNIQPEVLTDIEIPVTNLRSTEGLFDFSIDSLHISISGTQNKEFKSFYELKQAGLPLQLEEGKYKVVASTYPKEDKKVDKVPYFEGVAENVVIDRATVTNVQLVCKFVSIGVELQIGEQFRQSLDEQPDTYAYQVIVLNGHGEWVFQEGKQADGTAEAQTAPGYFLDDSDGSLEVRVNVRLNDNSKWYPERTYHFKNNGTEEGGEAPKRGEYYIIHLEASKESPDAPEPQLLRCSVKEGGE